MAEIFTFVENQHVCIKIVGRVSFIQSESLSSFLSEISLKEDWKVFFYMNACESMDSTFMGTLVQIGLDLKNSSTEFTLINISDYCYDLLDELGVGDFFTFVKEEEKEIKGNALKLKEISEEEQQKYMYETHKTLVDIYKPNQEEFKFVLEYLKPKDDEDIND